MKFQPSKLALAAIGAIGLIPSAWVPHAVAATSVASSDKPFSINIEAGAMNRFAHAVVHSGTLYVEESDVIASLEKGMNIKTKVNDIGWDWTLPKGMKMDSQLIKNGKQADTIKVGGRVVGTFDPLSVDGKLYVPIHDIRMALQPLGILSGWDPSMDEWTLCQPQPTDEVAVYLKKHPGWQVTQDAELQMGSPVHSFLFVQNDVGSDPRYPVTTSVISPTGQMTEFKTSSFFVGAGFKSAPTPQGTMIASITNGMDISQCVDWLQLNNHGKVVCVASYSAYNGLGIWLQNGHLRLLVGNGAGISKLVPSDDFVVTNVLYTWNGSKFMKDGSFTSGGYYFEPKLKTNPDAAAFSLLDRVKTQLGQQNQSKAITSYTIAKVAPSCTKEIQDFYRRYSMMEPPQFVPDPEGVFSMTKTPWGQASTYEYSTKIRGFKLMLTEKRVAGQWTAVDFSSTPEQIGDYRAAM